MPCSSHEAVAAIRKRLPANFVPKVGIMLGSGLGAVSAKIENAVVIEYEDLPNFSVVHHEANAANKTVSQVEGHGKKLHLGFLHGIPVACLEGRAHPYEGGNAVEVIKTLIRSLKLLGCEILLTTNAVGSLHVDKGAGNLMLIKDQINFMFANPLIGKNDENFGDRFVSMDNVYDAQLRAQMLLVAQKHQIPIHEGVYLATSGPTFETHAEIRMFKMLGADAVGMSTVPETIIARHCGMRVISVASITNLAAGLSDEVLSHEGTLKGAKLATENLEKLFLAFFAEGVVGL